MLTLRIATDADAPNIAALTRRSFAKQVEALALSERESPKYVAFETEASVRERVARGTHITLAHEGAVLIGTVSWVARSGGEKLGEIARLAVLPEHRGFGYGRELMRHAESELVNAGMVVAEVSVVARFERLRSYYEALGYLLNDSHRVAGLPFDLLFMRKSLADKS
jgi:predicted N-acetyltransferase YhbS